MKTIAILSQKGGSGKTTTSWALVNGLTLAGRKTLAVDMDGQQDLSWAMGGAPGALMEVLQGRAKPKSAIQETAQGDLLAGADNMALLDLYVKSNEALSKVLRPLESSYDFCVVDTPPALGRASLNALTASDGVILTVLSDVLSIKQLQAAFKTIAAVQAASSRPEFVGVLVTMYDKRPTLNRECLELLEEMAATQGAYVFKTKIRAGVALREALANRENPFKTHGRAGAVVDYVSLIKELCEALGV